MDVLSCPSCGGRLQHIAFSAEALVAMRTSTTTASTPAGLPRESLDTPELFDPGPSYDTDPA